MTRYFKVLTDGNTSGHTRFKWPKPSGERPGKWVKVAGPLFMCRNGLHVATIEQLPRWLDIGLNIYEVETRGEHLDAKDKSCWREARLLRRVGWDERSAQLFSADCAEHVLPIFEKKRPGDDRPRRAIQAARDFAEGRIGREELRTAADAYAAADAAAYADAYAAAAAAAYAAAYAAYAAAYAAYAAADAAAYAAYAAADAAAYERQWQAQRLAHYLGIEP